LARPEKRNDYYQLTMASSNTPKKKKTAKNSASERFVPFTDEDVERFVEAEANKNTQRKMHSNVVSLLMKSFLPNENETWRLQDILPVRKKSGDEYDPTTLRGIYIASVERYLKTLHYSESTTKGQRSTVELFERLSFKQISQFRDDTVVQFVWRLRQRAASCDFAEFNSYFIFGLIDKCYSSQLRCKFNLEQEGTVALDCLLMNTDK